MRPTNASRLSRLVIGELVNKRQKSSGDVRRRCDTDSAEFHAASLTARLPDELPLYRHRPGQDEPDSGPLAEPEAVRGQLETAVEARAAMLTGIRLEDDLGDLL